MRVIFTGGGTGGHIYPAVAAAAELKRRTPGTEIIFIGTKSGIEAKVVPEAGFPIIFIPAAGFSKNPLRLFRFLLFNTAGILKALLIIKNFKPDLVVGSGGFVSAPVLQAAKFSHIPYILLEQNVLPGKVTRMMASKAEKIMISFEESKKSLPVEKTVLTGNPVRKEIIEAKREEALKKLKLSPDCFTILITGASQGAKSLNSAVIKALPQWKDKNWQIIHLTGRKNYNEVKQAAEKLMQDFTGKYLIIDYTEDMASLYASANLAIARAGASTLAEITARGLPAILVPYPYAADNHQEKNARWIEKVGGAVVIDDVEVEEKLCEVVLSLASSPEKLKDMSEKSGSLGRPDALSMIIDEIMSSVSVQD